MYTDDQFGFKAHKLFKTCADEWNNVRKANNCIIDVYEACSRLDTDDARQLVDNHKETIKKLREINRDTLILISRVNHLTSEKTLDDFMALHVKFLDKWNKTNSLIYKFRDDVDKLSI